MAITIVESFESRSGSLTNRTFEYIVFATGADSENDIAVRNKILATAPTNYDGLFLDDVSAKHLGAGLWRGTATYIDPSGTQDDSQFEFDTGGGTAHVAISRETVNAWHDTDKLPGPPNFRGLIGVNGNRVEGTDIVVPKFDFSETHRLANDLVTPAYRAAVCRLTGTVNNAPFKGFNAGEVLFLGARGSKQGANGKWELNFRFSASPNIETMPPIGEIEGISKGGWEYLWVLHQADFEDSEAVTVQRPIAVYAERLYEFGDFSVLGIGT